MSKTVCTAQKVFVPKIQVTVVCDIDFIVITGNILRSVNDIPIVKPGISLYRRSLYRGSAPYILLQLLLGKQMLIIILGISVYRSRSLNRVSTVVGVFFNVLKTCQKQFVQLKRCLFQKYRSPWSVILILLL